MKNNPVHLTWEEKFYILNGALRFEVMMRLPNEFHTEVQKKDCYFFHDKKEYGKTALTGKGDSVISCVEDLWEQCWLANEEARFLVVDYNLNVATHLIWNGYCFQTLFDCQAQEGMGQK